MLLRKRDYIIPIILLILIVGISGCIEIGKGTSKDTIYGIEHSGLIWKTYKVWLTFEQPTSENPAIYAVSSNDKELIDKIKEAAANKRTVIVSYRDELWVWPWEYSSNTIITNVEYDLIKELGEYENKASYIKYTFSSYGRIWYC